MESTTSELREKHDLSGVSPVPVGGAADYPIHAASGIGYGQGFPGNAHRHVPDGWMPAVRYLVEELGADVNQRDDEGYTPADFSEPQIAAVLQSRFIDRASWLFYEHEEPYYPDY